jgi:16S rRNA C967 or C1407 C5-methylase (RsmB/RsmF family)
MLPVLALHEAGYLKLSSRVLDMCASPGSKTLQALEIVGKRGRIVANDILETRLDSLKQAVERSGMPEELTKRIYYTCQDATQLKVKSSKPWDAVLCDVPCSGDGTCRKDKHILPMWKPNHGNDLHETQLKILLRSIHLVKVGGVVCYSTCSFNPVEDEAVVAAALRKIKSEGKSTVELVKWPEMPGFIRRKGVCDWRVADYTGEDTSSDDLMEEAVPRLRWHNSFQEAIDANMINPLNTMWPNEDGVDELHLERCTRLWPQDQDSGGFFLALIRKNS